MHMQDCCGFRGKLLGLHSRGAVQHLLLRPAAVQPMHEAYKAELACIIVHVACEGQDGQGHGLAEAERGFAACL